MNKLIKTISLASIGAMIFWNQPVYRKYEVTTNGQIEDLRIVFLTDLHNTEYGKNHKKLLRMIHEARPDLLFFGGDIADEKSSAQPVNDLLKQLEGKYPMYYISGNHEYWMDDPAGVHQMFRDYGVRVLINETVQIETRSGHISLLGLDDPDHELRHSDRIAINQFLASSYDETAMSGYKVLLSHRPEHIDAYMKYGFDLILSGHAHGGQVRLPGLINGLYAPNQGLLPQFAGGHYKLRDTDFIVSRGLSLRAKLPRIMNPPEVVVVHLKA